jgi:hypothetical protein
MKWQGYVNIINKPTSCVISGFLRGVNEVLAVLGCYAALIGCYLPTFRNIFTVQS